MNRREKNEKLISALLVLALLVSSASIVFAEESAQLTSERVMERLAAGDDAAADVFGQISNAALRLAEMTAAVASVKVDNQDDVDHLNRILDAVSEADAQNPDTDEKLSIGVIKTLEGLVIFEQQVDEEGKHLDDVRQVIQNFTTIHQSTESVNAQTVNALYQSIQLTALLVAEHATSQEMLEQVSGALTAFSADDQATETVQDQLETGARWLCRMLTALAKLRDPDGSFLNEINEMAAQTQADVDAQEGQNQRLATWLIGCVKAMDVVAREMGN